MRLHSSFTRIEISKRESFCDPWKLKFLVEAHRRENIFMKSRNSLRVACSFSGGTQICINSSSQKSNANEAQRQSLDGGRIEISLYHDDPKILSVPVDVETRWLRSSSQCVTTSPFTHKVHSTCRCAFPHYGSIMEQ